MICSLFCTVTGSHPILSFPTSSLLASALQSLLFSLFSRPLVVLQRHSTTTTTRTRLNINADTNNKWTNKHYNIETKYMFAWNINSWSVIHRSLFLFIHSFYNQADVWRAYHNPVYEKREKRKEVKLDMAHCCPLLC